MHELTFREATAADLAFIDGLVDEDAVAAARDAGFAGDAKEQRATITLLARHPDHGLYMAECEGEPVGSFQLSFIPGLSRRGAWRGQIEAVRVAAAWRGKGIGGAMMRWAVARCEERGCYIVQLTSDRTRADAHRFYEALGFKPTHTGFKLTLPQEPR